MHAAHPLSTPARTERPRRLPAGSLRRPIVVWGNCQAHPLAELLAMALENTAFEVVRVPPVFEIDAAGLDDLRLLLPSAAALVSQPIRNEYATPGCGTDQLAALLPGDAALIRFPVTYDSSAFPYQVNAHRGDGVRIDAPLTDYHDLRVMVAAERGMDVTAALDWWPVPSREVVTTNAAMSRGALAAREVPLDVRVSDLLVEPVMFTLSHPMNSLLTRLASQVLAVLGVDAAPVAPEREYLGARRAPVEAAVADALGWPSTAVREHWLIDGRPVDQAMIIEEQLAFYARYPDIVADSRVRHADRLGVLGL